MREVPQLEPELQRRYDAVAAALVTAINARDAESYRALHTDAAWETAIPWWREMFPEQLEAFGGIVRAWAPRRGLIKLGKVGFRGDEGNGATFVVRFEEPAGGALSFELNADGKIVRTSVMIGRQLGLYEADDAEPIYEREPATAD
jgi:hypothetical protein